MEFEELQKIWMAGDQEAVYVINEKALHNRIISKKNTILRIVNLSELVIIIVNIGAAVFLSGLNYWYSHSNVFMYIMAAWMFLTSIYVLISRVRRLNEQPQYDRSMRAELQHGIATATYQVRLSQLMRLNIIPICAFCMLGVGFHGKSAWLAVGILVFFTGAYFLSGWEHNIYRNKKRELELLKGKLDKE